MSEEYAMSENESNICTEILRKLLQRPAAKLLYDIPDDIGFISSPTPITLHTIQQKLEKKFYASYSDFVQDCRCAFYAGLQTRDPFLKGAAHLLQSDFENLLNYYHLSLTCKFSQLNSIDLKLQNEKQNNQKKEPVLNEINNKLKPACELVNIYQPENVNALTLKRDLALLNSSYLLTLVAAYAHRLQPESISIDSQLSFNLNLMTDETIKKVDKYLHILAEHAIYSDIRLLSDEEEIEIKNRFINVEKMEKQSSLEDV